MQSLKVEKEESEQKLFNFLQRRLEASKSETHKWIRSGQVRINSKRCTAFDKVKVGDEIRVPPFALLKNISTKDEVKNTKQKTLSFDLDAIKIYEDSELLVINKPCGLAVQGGSKQNTSLIDILKEFYKNSVFAPTPAHRLDMATSGLLLIAKSYSMLQKLHISLQNKESEKLQKIYRAQVHNIPPKGLWKDYLLQEKDIYGYEKIATSNDKEKGQEALSKIEIIQSNSKFSLIEVDLITGRKHQIRVQCASRNCPIFGDKKYGIQDKADRLYLHAYKIHLEGEIFIAENKDFMKVF